MRGSDPAVPNVLCTVQDAKVLALEDHDRVPGSNRSVPSRSVKPRSTSRILS